jgi:hypothetical protein
LGKAIFKGGVHGVKFFATFKESCFNTLVMAGMIIKPRSPDVGLIPGGGGFRVVLSENDLIVSSVYYV